MSVPNRRFALAALCLAHLPLLNAAEPPPDPQPTVTVLPDTVVTASRTEQARSEVPVQMEVLTARDLDRTSALFITDALKKNASVDVIQYPGGMSGIGLRGFRPEFSGTSQRVLILMDGRPAGITNLGNLPMAGLGRVEVVKGAASAVYGASAMGGVVNFISEESRGPLAGRVGIGLGSFDTRFGEARLGGDLAAGWDFDVAFLERTQARDLVVGRQSYRFGDLELGGGATRQATQFMTRGVYGRLGYQLAQGWRVDLRTHGLFGRGIQGPGAESDGTVNQSSRDTDALSADIGLTGEVGAHRLSATLFSTREDDTRFTGANGTIETLASERDTRFLGLQLQDSWQLLPDHTLTFGLDLERAENENLRYLASGARAAPFSPDDRRETTGVYADLSSRFLQQSLVLNVGARYDEIRNEARETPLLDSLLPGRTKFSTFNPRAGLVWFPVAESPLRVHASAGRGFVAPLVRQVAGRTEETAGDQLIIGRSNPDLNPESSRSYDLGVGYSTAEWGADLTLFRTDVRDKIESVIVINTPTLRETTWVNAQGARAEGLEGTLSADIGRYWAAPAGYWTLTSTSTYYFTRDQELPAGVEALRNVARFKINLGIDYDDGRLGARLLARHVRGMVDRDFSAQRIFTNGQGGDFTYPSLSTLDLDLRYRTDEGHEIGVQVDNIADRYYYEKNDYPAAGRAVYARYRYAF